MPICARQCQLGKLEQRAQKWECGRRVQRTGQSPQGLLHEERTVACVIVDCGKEGL